MERLAHGYAADLDASLEAEAVVVAEELHSTCAVRVGLVEYARLGDCHPCAVVREDACIRERVSRVGLIGSVLRELDHIPLVGSIRPVAPELRAAREDDLGRLLLYRCALVESVAQTDTVVVGAYVHGQYRIALDERERQLVVAVADSCVLAVGHGVYLVVRSYRALGSGLAEAAREVLIAEDESHFRGRDNGLAACLGHGVVIASVIVVPYLGDELARGRGRRQRGDACNARARAGLSLLLGYLYLVLGDGVSVEGV